MHSRNTQTHDSLISIPSDICHCQPSDKHSHKAPCIPSIVISAHKLYANNHIPDLLHLHPLGHLPLTYHIHKLKLPNSLCRNPFDTFVYYWHFVSKAIPESLESLPLVDCFDKFCKGVLVFGPPFEHVFGF